MKSFLNEWGLILAVFLPLAGALVMMLVPKESENVHRQLALVTSVAAAVVGVLIMVNFNYDRAGKLQFVVDHPWINLINSRFIMGIDGLSIPLFALTLLIVPLVLIYSWDHIPSRGTPRRS